MDKKDREILEYIFNDNNATLSEIGRRFGISRQAAHKRVKRLIEQGLLLKIGRTKNSEYFLTEEGIKSIDKKVIPKNLVTRQATKREIRFKFKPDESEDIVFDKVAAVTNLKKFLNRNALDICRYVFTEIFNNAIDHSSSPRIDVVVRFENYSLSMKIRDYGVGIFKRIANELGLNSESDAITWLIPGKTTTQKERHTGEGIFFSSKASREMMIKSHKLALHFDNYGQEAWVEKLKGYIKGTAVAFVVPYNMRKRLSDIFEIYAPYRYDFNFQISRVVVTILGKKLISRSQAKRLVQPIIGKFKEVIFDFKKVEMVGQGFLDELLRVFPSGEKDLIVKVINVPSELIPFFRRIEVDKNRVHLVDNQVDNVK